MSDRQAIQQFIAGDSINITSILSVATVTTATIVIKDPSLSEKANASMTKSADKVYSYVYQSASTDLAGDYIVTITVTYQGKNSVYQSRFVLVEQE